MLRIATLLIAYCLGAGTGQALHSGWRSGQDHALALLSIPLMKLCHQEPRGTILQSWASQTILYESTVISSACGSAATAVAGRRHHPYLPSSVSFFIRATQLSRPRLPPPQLASGSAQPSLPRDHRWQWEIRDCPSDLRVPSVLSTQLPQSCRSDVHYHPPGSISAAIQSFLHLARSQTKVPSLFNRLDHGGTGLVDTPHHLQVFGSRLVHY